MSVKPAFVRLRGSIAGILLCTTAALVVATFSIHRPWRAFVPLAFVAVLVVLAQRYGMAVGVLGSLVAALIFAYVLFSPYRSLRIDDKVEREAIAWMVLAGIAVSYLLLPTHTPRQR